MMRSRLPPMTFFVEQMSEGVLKPEVRTHWFAPFACGLLVNS